jgi:hypothetical protein
MVSQQAGAFGGSLGTSKMITAVAQPFDIADIAFLGSAREAPLRSS